MAISDQLRSLGDKSVTPGPDRKCSLCGRLLANAEMAVNSHLRTHVKTGELTPAEEPRLRYEILRRTFKGWK